MTTILIRKDSDQDYRGFTCMGHAGYAKGSEPDILCASVSVLVINTVNAMEKLAGERMTVTEREETGFIQCELVGKPQEKSRVLLDAMVLGLQALSRSYGRKFLQVKFEEV